MEDWVSIKNIRAKNPKLGTRKIAELLGISRNTVKKALKSDEAPKYNRGITKVNEQIAPFEGFIKESFLTKKLKALLPNSLIFGIDFKALKSLNLFPFV